ncbi:hypothetical protein KEM55_006594 [Ascosphaera atra]|nr:hypothetical protein KEM55_006594 [Ascosphaera atra]
MSFHETSKDIRVEDGHILKATCFTEDGGENESEFDLNTVLGNIEGVLEWDNRDFAESAHEVEFSIEGEASVPVLRCHCGDGNGGTYSCDKNLAERIANDNGNLVYN